MLEIIPQIKKCTKCKAEKTVMEFYKCKTNEEGLRAACKLCVNEYYKANKEHIVEIKKEYQKTNKEKISEQGRAYYKANKDSIAKYKKEHRKANKYSIAKYQKEYLKANKEKIAEQKKEYNNTNKEKIAKYKKEHQKQYRKTPKGKATSANYGYKRRATTKQGDVTSDQILELQSNTKMCYWCNKPLKNTKVHIDHYEPLSKGGKHTISNLVVSCSSCNQSKQAKDPIVFANSIGRLL